MLYMGVVSEVNGVMIHGGPLSEINDVVRVGPSEVNDIGGVTITKVRIGDGGNLEDPME